MKVKKRGLVDVIGSGGEQGSFRFVGTNSSLGVAVPAGSWVESGSGSLGDRTLGKGGCLEAERWWFGVAGRDAMVLDTFIFWRQCFLRYGSNIISVFH
jgi:hypothetical protein